MMKEMRHPFGLKALPEDVQALRVPFQIRFPGGGSLDRWVYAYVIHGESVTLVDCAVASYSGMLFEALEARGAIPDDIRLAVLTHAHPDHIGGASAIRERTGCTMAAHRLEKDWIEDVELQNFERPVPGFRLLVEGPVTVDRVLEGAERIDTGRGRALEVIHTPGHARGHIALYLSDEGTLFSGDAVPVPGEIPMYEDLIASVRSIRIIQGLKNLDVLLSSWDEPKYGDEILDMTEGSLDFLQRMHECVLDQCGKPSSIPEAAKGVIERLGLDPHAMNPLFFRTIQAHMNAGHIPDVRGISLTA